MLILVDDIKVKKRIRKEMGDITGLAESMKNFGQMSPILITKNNVLVAGGRRLEAAKSLGWRTINASVTEIPNELTKLEYELEENIQRRDFTPEETAEAARKIYQLRNPSLLRRILNWLIGLFRQLFRIDE